MNKNYLKLLSAQHHQVKLVTSLLVLIAATQFAGLVYAQADSIINSSHDLSVNGDITGGFGVCEYCHGAHGNEDSETPLWNRSAPQTVFTLYSSDTISPVGSPGPESVACLSCHDGTTAFDALNGGTGTSGNNMDTHYPGSSAILGSNLGNDHPIGVSISADTEGIHDESSITAAGFRIYSGNLECASCHNVHSDGFTPFLRREYNESFCLTCHNK